MKRLLLPLLAALALPTAVNAEEFTVIKPKNIYSYKKSSLVKWENDSKRYIDFKGTTLFDTCLFFSENYNLCYIGERVRFMKNYDKSLKNLVWPYSVDCNEETFNRENDFARGWNDIWMDPTAKNVALKYCPIEEWSKLPNK